MAASNGQKNQIPVLQTFQFENAGFQSGQCVNLFRGNLAFPLKILSLPSRNGMELSIQMLYQSNCEDDVSTWNLDAQIGILGLGWQMPYDRVLVDPKLNGTSEDNQYYLDQQGQTQKLIQIPGSYARGTIQKSALDSSCLNSGQIDLGLAKRMRSEQIPVSDQALVSFISEDSDKTKRWLLNDPVQERFYYLLEQEQMLEVSTGGLSFELENYLFWQISYYPEYEKWEIIKEDGSRLTYGGSGQALRPQQASNVVQYGIRWQNWQGSSYEAENQMRYASAWNIAKVENPHGDYHIYNYFVVEQCVGSGSLTYTKECHVQEVQNDVGWSCQYHYLPMVYDNSSLDAPKEYLDPHKDPSQNPGTTPDAYQSRYITYYLDHISVLDHQGEPTLKFQYDYFDLQNLCSNNQQNPLAKGAGYKRYLRSVTQHMASGEVKQGAQFDYYFTQDLNQNRGALKQLVYPSGGIIHFSYDIKTIGADKNQDPGARNLTVANPFGAAQKNAPRIWYGGDYIVCGWYNQEQDQLKLNVFTWVGRWCQGFDEWLNFDAALDIDALQVATSSDTFLLSLGYDYVVQTDVYLFRRKHLCQANWQIEQSPDGPQKYTYQSKSIKLDRGENFFLINDQDNDLVDLYAWNWMLRDWQVEQLAQKSVLCQANTSSSYSYYTTAYNNYYLIFCYDQTQQISQFSLYYRDGLMNWHAGGVLQTDLVRIPKRNGFSYFNLAPSDSFIAAVYIDGYTATGSSGFSAFDFTMQVLAWDESYQNLHFATIEGVDQDCFKNIPSSLLTSLGPIAVENTLVGAGPNIYYYNGVTWKFHSLGIHYDNHYSDPSTQFYWYAYGAQSVLNTENTSSGIYSQLSSLNPSNPAQGWQVQVMQAQEPPPASRYLYGYPTLSDTYLSQNSAVYNPSVYPTWNPIDAFLLGQLSIEAGTLDTTTMINQAPHFLAFMSVDNQNQPLSTYVAFFKNGDFIRNPDDQNPVIEHFSEQQMFRVLNPQHRQRSALAGRLPAIIDGFMTFPSDESIDEASQLTIHRYSNYSLRGPVHTFVVSQIMTDTGYEQLQRCYAYADLTAAQDASGSIVRFQTVIEYQGCSQPEHQENGYTVSHFYNGLPPMLNTTLNRLDLFEDNHYSMLDGTLILQESYNQNGDLLSSSQTNWTVRDLVAIDAAETQTRWLFGGLPQIVSTVSMHDGISILAEYEYSLGSGNTIKTSSAYYGSTGERIIQQNLTVFAYQFYPELWTRNILGLPAQSIQQAKFDLDPDFQIQSHSLQTYQEWAGVGETTYWDVWENYTSVVQPAPVFTAWDGGESDPAWLKVNQILTRDAYGHILESIDLDQIHTTNLYDDNQQMLLALFKNASRLENGISYDSFESYQANQWTLQQGASGSVIYSDAYTGEACYCLTTTGVLAKATSLTQFGNYVFSFWLKTPLGADSTQISVTAKISGGTKSLSKAVPLTDGEWTHFQWIVDLDSLQGITQLELQIAVSLTVGSDLDLRIDDVYFTPLASIFNAYVYDAKYLYQIATLSPNGNTSRINYNLSHGPLAAIGAFENPTYLGISYCVTQDHLIQDPGDFPTLNPNYALSLSAQKQGFYDDFKADALDKYDFINSEAANWQVQARQLQSLIQTSEPLGAQVQRSGFATDSLGIYVQTDGQTDNLVSLGTGQFFVLWNGARWQLVKQRPEGLVTLAENTVSPLEREWLLLVFDNRLMFFAGGIRIFNYHADEIATQAHGVLLGSQKPSSFMNLIVLDTIGLSINYLDGLSRSQQLLHMESGSSAIMQATLYDSLGREAITVKPSRVTIGQVPDPFAYYAGYILNGSNQGSVWQNLPIEGPVNDFHPDDQGYPFARTVFEASPNQRPLKEGLPGRDFAISMIDGVENSHIATYAYGINTDQESFLFPLPPGQYTTTTLRDPDGNLSTVVSDAGGNTIGSIQQSAPHAEPVQIVQSSQVYDVFGRLTASIPPNYYTSQPHNPDHEIPASAVTYTYDGRDRRKTIYQVDRGLTSYIYDNGSRLRFSQDASGEAQGYFHYFKFDVLGRQLEEGTYPGVWNEVFLQQKADQEPDWPSPATTWSCRYVYDGNDETENLVGRQFQGIANNSENEIGDVVETYYYSRTGQTLREVLSATAYDQQAYFVESTYTASGLPLSVFDSVTKVTKTNHYNSLGQIVTIVAQLDEQEPLTLARLSYEQNGQLSNLTALPDQPTPLFVRSYRYLSPGWLESMDDAFFSESLQYTQGSCQNSGYFNGTIANQGVSYRTEQPRSEDFCFSVDSLNRMLIANKEGEQNQWVMDANSNITQYTHNDSVYNYTFESNGNRLASVTAENQDFEKSYQYTPNGNIDTISQGSQVLSNFLYFSGKGQVQNIEPVTNALIRNVAYQYNGNNGRVLKTVNFEDGAASQSLFVGGGLLQLDKSSGHETSRRFLALNSISAFYDQGRYYFILSDHLGSTRLIVADDGTVAAQYDYDIYGLPETLIMPDFAFDYLYTGQFYERELGFYNYKARFYDPAIGRFLMFDPAFELPSPYAYAKGNPMMWNDPSGCLSSKASLGLAITTGILGGLAVIGGVVLSIATMGAAAPVLFAGSVISAALIGGGLSSFTYSFKGSDWDAKDWGIGLAVGVVSGVLAAGVGALGGAVNGAIFTSTLVKDTSFGIKAAVQVIGTTGSGAITGGAVNGAATLMSNALQKDHSLWQGVGVAFGTGTAFGAIGGFFGGVVGLRASVARSYRATDEAVGNFNDFGTGVVRDENGIRHGLTGSADEAGKSVLMGNFQADGTNTAHFNQVEAYSPGQLQPNGRTSGGTALMDGNERISGFSIREKSTARKAVIGFGSATLNTKGTNTSRFMPQGERLSLMSSLKYQPNLRLQPVLIEGRPGEVNFLDKAAAFMLRAPW